MARETVKIEGLDGVLKTLRELPPEVVSKNGGPVRSALAKAARMMRDEAAANVQKIIDAPNIGESQTESIGLLKKSIQARRGRLKGEKGELYVVRIKPKQMYPDKFQDKRNSVSAAKVGRQLEYGTEKRMPMPWLRPAFDAKKGQVITLFVSELNKKLGAIVRKLARKNRVPA